MKKLSKKFWAALMIFGLVGQVAWVVENMYFNVFIYKMFHATASDISAMVSASSVAAALTTILIGALSDKMGKRKLLICLGYICWGITILGFGAIRMDLLEPMTASVAEAAALGVTLVIILDCVMTFFGSAANDAAYNAWLTDKGDEGNRGKIEGFNSMMPLVAILVVFGGFMGFNLDVAKSWTMIYLIIGILVIVIGILGFFIVEESAPKGTKENQKGYWKTVIYSFKPSVVNENRMLYAVLLAFAIFGISIQVYMPYLILYYEQSLKMTNYVFVMAPAIIIAAIVTAFYGRAYDQMGFKQSLIPSLGMLMLGYIMLFLFKSTGLVFIGSLFMMSGYLTGMAVFGAKIRDHIPKHRAGQFQGIRIIGQVLIPGIIGPAIGAFVLRNAQQIENNDGTYSFLPNRNIFAAALLVAIVLCIVLVFIFKMVRNGHHDLWTESGEKRMNGDRSGWQQHPRPQMKRQRYQMLNGTWKLENESITVPFAPQSKLSEYRGKIGKVLNYQKEFELAKEFDQEKILLHFDAVDQVAKVWVNDILVGEHEGGYLPFVFDITKAVKRQGNNLLKVQAIDTLDKKYPYGKQCKKRGGMWYTPISGIWKNVWLENVPEIYMEKLVLKPDLQGVAISLQGTTEGFAVDVTMPDGSLQSYSFEKNEGYLEIPLEYRRLWTPEDPYLYEMTIMAGNDTVVSYMALRTIQIKEVEGIQRVCLNEEPIFLHGLLDQGYYSDGIYLPAEEEEYDRDILRMKELGFNLLRKHIKVEPDYFYYACDKLGMLIMQDMVNNGPYSYVKDTVLPTLGMKKKNDTKGKFHTVAHDIFVAHTKDTIRELYNHPCIVAYTIFNEGWGQFYSDKLYDIVKELDDTRLIDAASGWFAGEKNDFDSDHIYFKAIDLNVKERPYFVSECGGYSMMVDGHYYSKYNTYGYGGCEDIHTLTKTIVGMYDKMIVPFIKDGVCGCVYTQLSDVEDEINGLYTYDRKVCKVEKEKMQELAKRLKI